MMVLKINYFSTFLLFFFFGLLFESVAQVTISNPINKAVYQRVGTGNGTAKLVVSGSYSTGIATSVQARLVTPGTSTPIAGFNWTSVDNQPSKGVFYGSLNEVPAGWYTLEVRVMKNGAVQESAQIDRVGVGDVFLIAGQSNSSGWSGSSGFLGSTDDRVVSHNYYLPCPEVFPNYPTLSKIEPTNNIGTTGENAWAYGKLGEDLVGQTGFPIAFFNAGTGGSSIENQTKSMVGDSALHPFIGIQFCNDANTPLGFPYRTIQNTMSYYNSLFGMKALLWHQGESDTYLNTTSGDYQSRLTSLINFTRNDFKPGWNMPWVVSRASYFEGNTNGGVISGQNSVINSDPLVFAGPITDGITGPTKRVDNVHFTDLGLVDLANEWKNYLNPTFFSNAIASEANVQPSLGISINGINVTLTAPSASSYKWVSGNNYNGTTLSTSSSYTASTGTYSCYLTDANGNITMSQVVDVSKVKTQVDNNVTCTSFSYLSDLKPFSISNGYGPIGLDKSNGEQGDGDGATITLNGVTYSKGLGVHANSELVYLLPLNKFMTFKADIGVDDEVGSAGKVKFQVFNDNTLLYESPEMTGSSSTISVNVSLSGVTKLRLKVIAGNAFDFDHADWANARLICDITPPTNPGNLAVTSQLTKCLSVSWSASTDNIDVSGYRVLRNGVLVATLSGSQLNYTFSGLERNSSYILGVQAIDESGNESAVVTIPSSTLNLVANYPGSSNVLFGDICINTNVVPIKIPDGGIFEFVEGPNTYTLNASTGAFSSPTVDGFFGVKYTIQKNGACEDVLNVNIRTNTKPAPSVVTGGPTIVNVGTQVNFSSTCAVGHIWQDNSIQGTLSFVPSDTTKVFAFCRNNGCLSDTSNQIVVKVVPDCPNSFNLVSSKDDLNVSPPSLFFKAASKIDAVNKLSGNSIIHYKAGAAILLKPGFTAGSGTVFSATIGGCP